MLMIYIAMISLVHSYKNYFEQTNRWLTFSQYSDSVFRSKIMAKYKETNDLEGDTSITTEVQQIKIIVRGFFFLL